MDVTSSIKGTLGSAHGTGALYLALLAFIAADILPTPGDSLTFIWQRNLRDKWKAGDITAAEFWRQNVAAYYIPNILWWILVFFIVINIPGSAHKKFYVAIGIIGAGALIGVVYNLYKKDLVQQQLEESLIPKQ